MSQSGVNPGGDRRRRVMELRSQGVSLSEIARRLSISRQAVFMMLKRARRDAEREQMAKKAQNIATTQKDPVEAVSAPERMTVRVPTRINPLTQWAEEEIDAEPAAADDWNVTKWRQWP